MQELKIKRKEKNILFFYSPSSCSKQHWTQFTFIALSDIFDIFQNIIFLFVPQTKRKSEKIQWTKMFYSCYYLQIHINTNPLCNDTCDRENIDIWYLV